jgi:hypothetical protein
LSSGISYREGLKGIQEPRPGRSVPSYPSGFAAAPNSLRAALSAMDDPHPEKWGQSTYDPKQEDWTDGCQGVTHDDRFWYFSQTKEPGAGTGAEIGWIHRITPDTFQVEDQIRLTKGDHVGDIDYYGGMIYASIEPQGGGQVQIAVLRTSPTLEVVAQLPLIGPQGNSCPWCAINPWNGYLWSSEFNATQICMYDPNREFAYVRSMPLYGADIKQAEGGVFTANGHLLMTSNETDDVRCFSVLDGTYLGSGSIEKSHAGPRPQEIQGLTYWPGFRHVTGDLTSVHIILVDFNSLSSDQIYFKHYAAPSSV